MEKYDFGKEETQWSDGQHWGTICTWLKENTAEGEKRGAEMLHRERREVNKK